jgi:type IV pilus assembly protein PilM
VAAKLRHGKIVALDWDARTLRVVNAIVTNRGVKIDRLLAAAIPPELDVADPAQMGVHIRRVLDEERIGTTHAVVDIPRDQAILKTLNLPSTRVEDFPGMVEIQIARELPFPAGEAVIDFVVSGAAEGGASDVLVAAVRREVLHHYETVVRHAGLRLERVGLRPYANQVAVAELLKHAIPEHVLFIDLGPTLTEIDVFRNGSLTFSRAASVVIPKGEATTIESGGLRLSLPVEAGSGAMQEAAGARPSSAGDSVIQSLVVEVTRSIEAYRTMDAGANIDHVVIGGDLGVEEALAETLHKRLGVTTQLYNPATAFGWEPDEGAAAAAFASALGLVLSHADGGSLHFDFHHPKRTESRTQRRLRKAPLAAAVAVLFIAAAGIVAARTTKPERDDLARIEASIKELEERQSEYKKFLDVAGVIREFDKGQLVWVDELRDAFLLMPSNEEWLLTNLDMNQKERRITLKTKSKNRETALDVEKRLEAFRREGRDRARFEVRVGGQAEKKGEKYPFQQDVRITVLNDEAPKKGASGRK